MKGKEQEPVFSRVVEPPAHEFGPLAQVRERLARESNLSAVTGLSPEQLVK